MTEDNNALLEAIPINLSKGRMIAFVSHEDVDYVEKFVWTAISTKYRSYAIRSEKGNNKHKIHLSREIMSLIIDRELVTGETVRHLNKNSLDCTRDNLILKGSK